MYAILGTNQLPDLRGHFLEGADIGNQIIEAGLPNITGEIGQNENTWFEGIFDADGNFYTNGVFSTYIINRACTSANSDYMVRGVTTLYFNASLSNSIYGKANTVQPPAVTVRYYIRAK